jgi:NtrC-family two-component system sensor histidine kinase KinB
MASDHIDGPDMVSVSIVDTGPGVPLAFRSRIFDKFFRLEHHQADRPHARGAGIGLYMCRQIVELHGGDIECGSGPSDRGARITVKLPAKDAGSAQVVSDEATYINQ